MEPRHAYDGSLELRRAAFDGTDYERTALTEVAYLFAHGRTPGAIALRAAERRHGAAGGRDERGIIITFENPSQKALDRLERNYGSR